MTTVQQSYNINPDRGYPGQIAEPNSPLRIEAGIMNIPSGGETPRPGHAVFYSTGNDGWQLPDTSAQQLQVAGILTYRSDAVAPTNNTLEFAHGDEIFVVTMGIVWLVAGGAIERHNQVVWDTSDFKWNAHTRQTAIASLLTNPVESVNRFSVANNGLFKAAIGYGRVI